MATKRKRKAGAVERKAPPVLPIDATPEELFGSFGRQPHARRASQGDIRVSC